MTGKGKSVSIVIPAWNAAGRIGGVVRAARKQRGAGRFNLFEVIVVDDGSTDSTADEAEEAGARVIRQENRGPAAARNTGWRAARGGWVFFTDSDCYAGENWVERLALLLAEENTGAAGGSYGIANPRSLLARCVHEEILFRHRRMGREVRFLGSFNLASPREVLEEVGGFEDSYRNASGEDNDFSYRIRRAGYRLLFDEKSRVDHVHPENPVRYLREQARHGYWRMKLYREHPERMRGDDYSGVTDFLEPPLAVFVLLLLPFLSWKPVSAAAGVFLFVLLTSSLVAAVRIVAGGGGGAAMLLWPLRFVRAFARGIGMTAGIVRFWLAPEPAGRKR